MHKNQEISQPHRYEFESINQDLTWTTATVKVKGVEMISIQSIARAREDKGMYDLPIVFSSEL
jgi:hypothetical protein